MAEHLLLGYCPHITKTPPRAVLRPEGVHMRGAPTILPAGGPGAFLHLDTPGPYFHRVGNFQLLQSLVPPSAMARAEGMSLYIIDLSDVKQKAYAFHGMFAYEILSNLPTITGISAGLTSRKVNDIREELRRWAQDYPFSTYRRGNLRGLSQNPCQKAAIEGRQIGGLRGRNHRFKTRCF